MGVFSKLKGIFYDEVVVDEDVPEEELKKVDKIVKREVQEEKPKIEEIKYKTIELEPEKKEEPIKTDSTFSERDLFKSERTFNFTEFDDEEEVNTPPRRNVLNNIEKPANNTNSMANTRSTEPIVQEQPKTFKPSPVISPIYGILDKDYKKDEIKSKTVKPNVATSSVTKYDTVRRKAYGTLEDELEDTLNSINKISTTTIKNEINKIDKEVEKLEKTSKIEDLISKIDDATNEFDDNLTVGDLEDSVKITNFSDNDDIKEETHKDEELDNTLEHDLFNLIDSMYEKEN